MQKLLQLENSVNYVTQMSPTVSQTLLQSYSKIFHHPTSHLVRDRRDFFLYTYLLFRNGSRRRDENSAFEVPP